MYRRMSPNTYEITLEKKDGLEAHITLKNLQFICLLIHDLIIEYYNKKSDTLVFKFSNIKDRDRTIGEISNLELGIALDFIYCVLDYKVENTHILIERIKEF